MFGTFVSCFTAISTAPTTMLAMAPARYGLYIAALYAATRQAAKVNGAASLNREFAWNNSVATITAQNVASGYRRRTTSGSAVSSARTVSQGWTGPTMSDPA